MDVLQRTPDNSIEESSILETVTAVAAGKPLSCPNHDGNVSEMNSCGMYRYRYVLTGLVCHGYFVLKNSGGIGMTLVL